MREPDLMATVGEDPAAVASTLAQLISEGLVVEGKTVRLSPEGRERLNALLAEERSGVDQDVLAGIYDSFRDANNEFKALITDWQIKDGQPNAHDDLDYDAAVIARLDDVHRMVRPVIDSAATYLNRLKAYADKLESALAKVKAGDTSWLARPIADSYHTVWFELHQEFIEASGLTREDEARAGHAS
ncbi:Hypothetical protein MIP_00301 [Mycobacterium intracellulare subsp. intracellulare MTCC 9506]|uniref:Uncharacterized protein n=1 Tax=Mycobacterium indicus pranii (strain DSM 45239 / MTCC 9506) TaxID=1232724 RepID=J9W817_MYCIP|nr:Hypothetical protein MIP_00301 [Mycobacterium intracellulare subsp. intracellulare MTCC 9506]